MIAALFVQTNGCYFGLPKVEPWDETRDARLYAGPHPVVAHPPCERWGRYWAGGPAAPGRHAKGTDGGCFASALVAVRRWGGVLEHPEGSAAWLEFGLRAPPRHGGWAIADAHGGWTCCVEQGRYGHRAPKATWLYAAGVELPELRWGKTPPDLTLTPRQRKTGVCQRLSHRQRAASPIEFRDLLISIAATARASEAA